MRLALAAAAQSYQTPGYEMFVWRKHDIFYRSLAVPVAANSIQARSIDALRDQFAAIGREPRIEFFAESWQGLEMALLKAGWQVEMSMPAMWIFDLPKAIPAPDLIELHDTMPRAVIRGFLDGMSLAFGILDPAGEDEIDRLQHSLGQRQVIAMAAIRGDRIVGGAALTRHEDTAELQGVWVAQDYRGHGLGERLCRSLLSRYLRAPGRMVWLSAGGAGSRRLYERMGFKPMGTQLNLCLSLDTN